MTLQAYVHFSSVVLLAFFVQSISGTGWIEFCSGFDESGEFRNITSPREPDLSKITYRSKKTLQNNVKSVCGVGAYAFHQDTEFKGPTELINLIDGNCRNLRVTAGNVSSFHKIIYEHESSIIFYSEANYMSPKEISKDMPNEKNRPISHLASVIIVGSFSWELFFQPNFTGRSICLVPEIDEDLQVQGIPDLSIAPYNGYIGEYEEVRSLRKHCTEDEDQIEVRVGTEYRPLFYTAMGGIGVVSLIAVLVCIGWIVHCSSKANKELPRTTELQQVG